MRKRIIDLIPNYQPIPCVIRHQGMGLFGLFDYLGNFLKIEKGLTILQAEYLEFVLGEKWKVFFLESPVYEEYIQRTDNLCVFSNNEKNTARYVLMLKKIGLSKILGKNIYLIRELLKKECSNFTKTKLIEFYNENKKELEEYIEDSNTRLKQLIDSHDYVSDDGGWGFESVVSRDEIY